ncbi:MAG: hypothetical protein WD069_12570 [Planctomycetales bacterium]
MRRAPSACLIVAVALAAATARADHKSIGVTIRYPRVYGWTGTPYGPTQAHYQYERQYGRPWHGYGGNSIHISGGIGTQFGNHYPIQLPYATGYSYSVLPAIGGYGYGYQAAGIVPVGPYSGFGTTVIYPGVAYAAPSFGYLPPSPMYLPGRPVFVGANPFDNSVMYNALIEENLRWQQPLVLDPVQSKPRPVPQPSTAEAQLRSLRFQAHGDMWFREQNLANARARYQRAIEEAHDLSDPRFRLAFTFVGLGRYAEAVAEIRKGLELDPAWPSKGIRLTELYTDRNHVAKTSAIHRVTTWAKQDIRDPDRLFLLGVLLHFDGDQARAAEFFQAAYRLQGGGEHLVAFLAPAAVDQTAAAPAAQPPPPAGPQLEPADDPGLAIPPLPAPALPRPNGPQPAPAEPQRPAEPALPELPFPAP